jgi:hypothetical protein
MIVFCNPQVPHGLREKAVEEICDVSSFLEVVVKNNCLGDKFGIKHVSVHRNKELKVMKIAERACYRICSIHDVWSIQCEVD